MFIALREIKIDTTDADGNRIRETRMPGEAVPEAASWGNPSVWINRGDITDADGFVWRNRKKTGEQLNPAPGPSQAPPDQDSEETDPAKPIPTVKEIMANGYSERYALCAIAYATTFAAGGSHEEATAAGDAADAAYTEEHQKPEPSDGAGATGEPSGLEERQDEPETVEAPEPSPVDERQEDRVISAGDTVETHRGSGVVIEPPNAVEAGTISIPEPSQPPADKTDPEPENGTPGPSDEPAPRLTRKQLGKMTKAELLATAEQMGLEVEGRPKNAELVQQIFDAQE
jgi:hypothetical protein